MNWFAALALTLSGMPDSGAIQPWTEAVLIVEDPRAFDDFFGIAGWERRGLDPVSQDDLSYWDWGKGRPTTTELWCAPGADTGCLRLYTHPDAQEPVRPAARAWDTGGIFSIMMRSDDVDALYRAALDVGWWAESPPIRFRFGASELKNVVLTGPHGINFAVYERISPPFTAFPVGTLSQGFNSMRMVRDQPAAKAFYEQLGFSAVFDSDFEPLEPAWSNLSIPHNFTPIIRRKAAALQPRPGETGRVEVMQIVGFAGRDHSARANPHHHGIMSVRYPVDDLAAYRAQIEANGIVPVMEASGANLSGLGRVDIFAVRSPDGALTEFYEVIQ